MRNGIHDAKFLFCNEYEYELLKKHGEFTEDEILNEVYCMVETLGKDGARILVDGNEYRIPAFPEKCKEDPTGVGDAFRAGFLVGYFHNLSWETCGKMGSLASTYVLEQKGTQSHKYNRKEFVERYRTTYDDNAELDILISI